MYGREIEPAEQGGVPAKGPQNAPAIDWTRYRLTKQRVFVICWALLAITVGVAIHQFSQARENILPAGAPVGGDYVAFYGASIAAHQGDAAAIYDHKTFEQILLDVGPPRDRYGLTWQYPPTYYLIIAPLAFLPFVAGYLAWSCGTAALFFAVMRSAGFSAFFLFALLAAPSTFHAFITGQNGFLTASLIIVAALYADKRPVLAGLAAALLTIKPQLGVLLPVAFLAAGCWRAFFTAALGAVALAAAATGLFGVDIWQAFLDGAGATSDRLGAGVLPIFKMITPFAWARYAGAPTVIAATLHALFALLAVVIVWRVWRRIDDAPLRAAALCAGVFMVAPYGLYYEMIILAFPVAVLAQRAVQRGWMPFEQATIALMYIGPMAMPGSREPNAVSWGFPIALLIAAGVMRRIEKDHPGTFGFRRFPVFAAKIGRAYRQLRAPQAQTTAPPAG